MKRKILLSKDRQTELKQILTGTGHEPVFSGVCFSTIDIVKGLNYYAKNHSTKESKVWAMDWLKENHPLLAKKLNTVNDQYFLNRGFICRMISRGLVLNGEQAIQHLQFFKELSENKSKKIQQDTSPVVPSSKTTPISPDVLLVEETLDRAIENGKTITKIDLSTVVSSLKEVISLCDYYLGDLEENVEGYLVKTRRVVTATLNAIKTQATNLLVAKKKQRVVKTAAVTSKVVSTVKDPVNGVQGVSPQTIINKSYTAIFDPVYKRIRLFVSDSKFEMPSKKVIGFNEEKSQEFKIKNVDKFLEITGKRTFSRAKIERAIKTLKLVAMPIKTGLIRENQIVLTTE